MGGGGRERRGESGSWKSRHTSAAAAAFLRASSGVELSFAAAGPPRVRGGPPTLTVLGTEEVPACGAAAPTGRPTPAKLSLSLLQSPPIIDGERRGAGNCIKKMAGLLRCCFWGWVAQAPRQEKGVNSLRNECDDHALRPSFSCKRKTTRL